MKKPTDLLMIGELAARTGLSVSAIRFYEKKHLVFPSRNSNGQRRFPRSDIRRLSFILIAQQLGLSIAHIQDAFQSLPENRTPTAKDWTQISTMIQEILQKKITALNRMSETLDGCIGCGCLSLKHCKLYNPDDKLALQGTGPRIALGDVP